MKRTFIGVPVIPDKHLLSILHQAKEEFRNEKISWVPLENLHFTLIFLGNISEEDQKQVHHIIRKITGRIPDFSLKISGLSAFPSVNKPRIIWSGIEYQKILMNLQDQLAVALKVLVSFTHNEKRFVPHLTLARIKYPKDPFKLTRQIKQFSENLHQELLVDEIIFYESVLNQDGPVYHPLGRFPLRGGR